MFLILVVIDVDVADALGIVRAINHCKVVMAAIRTSCLSVTFLTIQVGLTIFEDDVRRIDAALVAASADVREVLVLCLADGTIKESSKIVGLRGVFFALKAKLTLSIARPGLSGTCQASFIEGGLAHLFSVSFEKLLTLGGQSFPVRFNTGQKKLLRLQSLLLGGLVAGLHEALLLLIHFEISCFGSGFELGYTCFRMIQ